jgi:hypothetical protein
MIQAGGFATPSETADPQGLMGAGNGLRSYDGQQGAGMRQSYHPSIDGEEPGHHGEYYAYGNNRNTQYGYSEAYDGYSTGPVPQRQSAHGYAYGGSGDQPEGYSGRLQQRCWHWCRSRIPQSSAFIRIPWRAQGDMRAA